MPMERCRCRRQVATSSKALTQRLRGRSLNRRRPYLRIPAYDALQRSVRVLSAGTRSPICRSADRSAGGAFCGLHRQLRLPRRAQTSQRARAAEQRWREGGPRTLCFRLRLNPLPGGNECAANTREGRGHRRKLAVRLNFPSHRPRRPRRQLKSDCAQPMSTIPDAAAPP